MATIVLTAVGTAFGGPIGGALGAVVGQQIDQRLFAPKARHGARLGDLSVQTSSYGSAIPKIFGLMRVAGTVIWATEIQEHENKSGGGKGRPKTVEYSYSANFAVALSGRPIRAVRRIWADGKLLRGAGGGFKSETGFRLHFGGEGQAPDPLIASVEGTGQAPAHRGIAYAVFEDFQLADYGNRIPSLSFEVEADGAPVTVGMIAEELSGGEVAAGDTMALAGFAASGDSVRGVLETLAEAMPLSLVETEERLRLERPGATEAALVPEADAGASADGKPARTEIVRRSATSVPSEVAIAYHDAARDYQTGLQRAARGGGGALQAERRALAAVLAAPAAKGLAEARLEALWAGRSSARLHLPWRHAAIRPGATLRLPGQPGRWRVAGWSLERMAVMLELVRLPAAPAGAEEASPGRPADQPDFEAGETRLILLDLPLGFDAPARGPKLVAAAAGTGPGWRPPALIASYDGGASWDQAGPVPRAAAAGTALTALAEAGSALLDLRGSVEVELVGDAMWLESRDDDALANGANLAALGSEMLQFGAAEPLGGRRFRLSRLLRGRRGTEWAAAAGHAGGEPFLLLEPQGLLVIEPAASAVGGEARLIASGLGGEAEAQAAVTGEALRPPAPVHFRASVGTAGHVALRWARRSRVGWAWLSGQDAPLGEDREAYRLVLTGSGGGGRTVTVSQPAFVYSAGQQQADGVSRPLQARLVQIGAFAASRPATLIIA